MEKKNSDDADRGFRVIGLMTMLLILPIGIIGNILAIKDDGMAFLPLLLICCFGVYWVMSKLYDMAMGKA